ncbi:hypothetical protein GKZ90_0016475 [Flavobacterium sp. MC2016-06]|uniref:hypothetical protein n=1 Tax=Flavobacterium sp. MC2016-06 TaxID=2676308 RepID=UPI0012BB0E65|nr:hypothetical protein [Flavobacterium sp. MC2016-06]MBU3860033.1 hypothetical protein [Flavobacterium sp. MC2016-06]
MKKLILFITIFCFLSCKKEVQQTQPIPKKIQSKSDIGKKLSFEQKLKILKDSTSKDSILSNDIQFINDSILKGKFKLDISKYEIEAKKNSCLPTRLSKKIFDEFYNEGFNNLGDLDGDGKDDSVFVLTALNYCEEGDSYYFTNNKIPRILTDSNCCHPSSIIKIGDIDEDGKSEIAEYYSSCASRYKAITIYSLKNDGWKEIKSFSFVLNEKYFIEKDFKRLFRKTSKNHLKYFEISDINIKGELIASWKSITIK